MINRTDDLVFMTRNRFNGFYHYPEKALNQNIVDNYPLLSKQQTEPCFLKDFSEEQPDMKQVLSLPDNLYKQAKNSLVAFFKKNQEKLSLDRNFFNLIPFPSARIKDFEAAVFGKALTPQERLSRYKMEIKSPQDALVGQQVGVTIQANNAEKKLSRLLSTGQIMLALLAIMMRVAGWSKKSLLYREENFKLLTDDGRNIQKDRLALQNIVDWMKAYLADFQEKERQGGPSISFFLNIYFKRKAEEKKQFQKTKDNAIPALRQPTPADIDKMVVPEWIRALNWTRGIQNKLSADKDKKKTSIQRTMTDNQSLNSLIQQLLTLVQNVRVGLGRLGK